MAPLSDKNAAINIVGAGIFGLSTAIHLARRGYHNVTVFDKQPYDETLYSYFKGCDGASADLNKIIRSAYGGESIYQSLTLEAIQEWEKWNQELSSGQTVVPGLASDDGLFIKNGHFIMNEGDELPIFERQTISNMEAAGYKDTQLDTSSPSQRKIGVSKGFSHALDPFPLKSKSKQTTGVLDTTGGLVLAGNSCRFALQKARQLGAKFVLDSKAGFLESLCYDDSGKKIIGIRTADQKVHLAAMTIVACGGWTPTLIPALDGLCETTAGSVALLKIPKTSPLFERFGPSNFPSWQYKMRDGAEGGLYGFPCDKDGWFKIGYRGTKYTNPVKQSDGQERSVPITRWSSSEPEKNLTSIPDQALRTIQRFLDEFLPELGENGVRVSFTRMCWYNDSFDNHFVIDHAPETEGLMIATAGSGHAFKLLPNIGNYIVDAMEGKHADESSPFRVWNWRQLGDGEEPYNVLMKGSKGETALGNVPLVSEAQLGLGSKSVL